MKSLKGCFLVASPSCAIEFRAHGRPAGPPQRRRGVWSGAQSPHGKHHQGVVGKGRRIALRFQSAGAPRGPVSGPLMPSIRTPRWPRWRSSPACTSPPNAITWNNSSSRASTSSSSSWAIPAGAAGNWKASSRKGPGSPRRQPPNSCSTATMTFGEGHPADRRVDAHRRPRNQGSAQRPFDELSREDAES